MPNTADDQGSPPAASGAMETYISLMSTRENKEAVEAFRSDDQIYRSRVGDRRVR
jgi:hypothetical protein